MSVGTWGAILPVEFSPEYQRGILSTRSVCVWERGSGKTRQLLTRTQGPDTRQDGVGDETRDGFSKLTDLETYLVESVSTSPPT